ncbi:MAG: translation elongation factor Ts [Bacillota bacterium]|nr:translation elongation factor Ts [Bacillota bacterium]
MQIDAKAVKALREKTGAGMMDCKKALLETGGDEEKAIDILREKGLAAAARRADRTANQGIVDSYIHLGGKIGVLVEVNCETDFVARNDEFRDFVKNICLQVAAANPAYLSKEDVPKEIIDKEAQIIKAQALNEGKPEKVIEKIVEGRLNKFYRENCLLDQAYIRDEDRTINELLTELIARIGENIVIRRFSRFEVGEGIEGGESC